LPQVKAITTPKGLMVTVRRSGVFHVFGNTILVNIVAFGLAALVPLVVFLTFLMIRYGPVITRIFEERPMFLPLRVRPGDQGEPVIFRTTDGLSLSGTYLRRRTADRVGVLVFCHEYLSDRWSYHPYVAHLRNLGFDLFTFDFRNHGQSESHPDYAPLQWATDYEVLDLRAALAYVRSRPDHDSAGFGLFGVSRGGSTALVVGAASADVWGVITDGAFPTRGTMTTYILRWAEIYVKSTLFLAVVPRWIYSVLGSMCLLWSQRRLKCRFPDIETAAFRLTPRPWLMIHGERDTYIGPAIAKSLFEHARSPKEIWIVPEAKHNRCRDCQPEAYTKRLADFLHRYAPRRPIESPPVTVTPALLRDFAPERGFAMEPAKLISGAPASLSG
jgi:pimeloyl-ACP methyl ester carboxylesterase